MFGIQKPLEDKMLVPGTGRRLYSVDYHMGIVSSLFALRGLHCSNHCFCRLLLVCQLMLGFSLAGLRKKPRATVAISALKSHPKSLLKECLGMLTSTPATGGCAPLAALPSLVDTMWRRRLQSCTW